jgi:soluble lytic murein transglycosylase-like protein
MHIEFIQEIKNAAKYFRLDPVFIAAVIATESNFDRYAYRYEGHYQWFHQVDEMAKKCKITQRSAEVLQQSSHGLMQIMGATACEMGLMDDYPDARIQMLYIPSINLKYGCRYLAWLKQKYKPDTLAELYACYNAGSIRRAQDGDFENQSAVNRFLVNHRKIEFAFADELLSD